MTLPLLSGGKEPTTVCREAEEIVKKLLEARGLELRELLLLCESPVEQMLVVALCSHWNARLSKDRRRAFTPIVFRHERADAVMEPQRVIQTEAARYRADLFVYVTRDAATATPERWQPTVVEVDGHDFHETTREQAARDRRRDRDLIRTGLRVIRFTGSEVFSRPFACAREIDALLRGTLDAA